MNYEAIIHELSREIALRQDAIKAIQKLQMREVIPLATIPEDQRFRIEVTRKRPQPTKPKGPK